MYPDRRRHLPRGDSVEDRMTHRNVERSSNPFSYQDRRIHPIQLTDRDNED